jgi:hypothetical protein
MRCFQPTASLFALCLCIARCLAFGIRSPPPLHKDIASSEECSGRLDGWQWNRCVLDDAVVWTAATFGHMQVSMHAGLIPSDVMGSHVQYTPFSRKQPFLLSKDGIQSQSIKQQLPPMVFALYIQSEVLRSWLWKPVMTCLLDFVDEEGTNPDVGWMEMTVRPKFHHNRTSMPEYGNNGDVLMNDVLSFNSNTEYITDNIVWHSFGQIFPQKHTSDEVYLLNVEANIQLFDVRSSNRQFFGPVLTWSVHFHVAFDRLIIPGSLERAMVSPKRSHAKLVSHKMCQSATLYPAAKLSQYFNARTQTLSIWFEGSAGKLSMTILSASVTHDRHGLAVAEFLVWFEADDKCGVSQHHAACTSFSISKMNWSCSVLGHVVPAHIETKSYLGEPRESVVSCTFESGLFSLDDHTVNVIFIDPSSKLQAVVPLCSLQRDRPIHKIVACSQSIYGADVLEARWPGVLQAWVLYHARFPRILHFCCSWLCWLSSIMHPQVKHLGFDHFTIYDTDGSAAPFLSPLLNSTFLTYFGGWAPTSCLRNLTATRQMPYCAETLMENQCLWKARGISEWAMLVHAPDCFLNDAPGLPVLFGHLDSMDHSKSSLLLPTYLFEFASDASMPARKNASTAADIFTTFNSRVCSMLNAYRHLPVIDPHMIQVALVHEAFDGFDTESRVYTATLAVNHYFQLFSSRTSASILTADGMIQSNDGTVAYCVDDRMAHVAGIVSSLFETYAAVK